MNRNKKEYQDLIQLLEQFLDLKRWGFVKVYTQVTENLPIHVIYNSQWCRVSFSINGGDRWGGREMGVSYGRLHAPNNKGVMIWKGERYRCWHHVSDALYFLDGLSPQEAVDQLRIHKQWPRIAEQFRQSEIGLSLVKNHPYNWIEWNIRLQAAIWSYYGQKLFELYDLRQTDLWEQFVLFAKEYYRLHGLKPSSGYPGLDKIC
jgi:hypothetical protein